MWDRGKLLLAVTLFTVLYHKVTAKKTLDMAPDSVDNTYSECREKAWEKFIHSGLLGQELNRSAGLQKAWTQGADCPMQIPGRTTEHTSALRAYAYGDADSKKSVDKAIETLGGNISTYETLFHFKSLHFLLMDSILLQPKTCKTFYIISKVGYEAKKGSMVRFGTFMKVFPYSGLQDEPELDDIVVLNITSCFFANLEASSCGEGDSALISPAEVFTVEEEKKMTDDDNDNVYTVIVLKHAELKTQNSCVIFSRSTADVSTRWLVLVLVALSLSCFNY